MQNSPKAKSTRQSWGTTGSYFSRPLELESQTASASNANCNSETGRIQTGAIYMQ